MRKTLFSALFLLTMAAGGQSAAGPFDGVWNTTMTCEAKGSAQGYTWRFTSTIANSNLHGERGDAGQPGYLALDGKINRDGSAKLTASGVVASTQYAHGPLVSTGEQYSYEVKSHFAATEGEGDRSTGLGIYGRPCHYVFGKQMVPAAPAKP
jgi:hypothetical protein